VHLKGHPGELSPKVRFFLFAGWLLSDRFKYVSGSGFCANPTRSPFLIVYMYFTEHSGEFDNHPESGIPFKD
jgi:hypothetical protein